MGGAQELTQPPQLAYDLGHGHDERVEIDPGHAEVGAFRRSRLIFFPPADPRIS